ncbi:MAG TPA: three-Cys-motif partner protein TcmP [Chitinophagaceae bacterium]|nr:three-Cys-motif partner protein TcmP [Chitinophagaceae bacterium]
MNQFGGEWTEKKIEMVVKYAKAYLTIMNKYPQFKTLYFDGFAGSGDIYKDDVVDVDVVKGTAIRVLEISDPKSFDMYYFVEKNEENKNILEETISKRFASKNPHIVCEDCNNKLKSMSEFLKLHPKFRVLAFIDPYGMALDWSSIEALKGYGIDMWILVPTGIGVNRLLKNNGDISEAWLLKLERFLGLTRDKIITYFYKEKKSLTLFGEETVIEKENHAIEKAGELYKIRLNEIFEFVSTPFPLTNSTDSIMYHFMMATNNKSALRIANDIIKNQ